jgi:hypothetical protein
MRKFILIISIALMSTSSCYANLSLASNEAPQTSVRQSVASGDASQAERKPQTPQVRPDVAIKHSSTPNSSTPRPRRVRHWGRYFQGAYDPCL